MLGQIKEVLYKDECCEPYIRENCLMDEMISKSAIAKEEVISIDHTLIDTNLDDLII